MTPQERAQARLDALASTMEPRLKAAFLRYVESLRPDELAGLVRLLDASDVEGAVDLLLNRSAATAAVQELRATFASAVQILTGRLAADLASTLRVRVIVPVLSPSLLDAVRRWENGAFARVQAEIREGLRQTIADQLTRGIGPRQVAVALKQGVAGGLTAYDDKIIGSFRAALESGRFGDALGPKNAAGKFADGRRLRDLRYDRTLAALQRKGGKLSQEQIEKMVAAYRRKLVAFRAETFARTASLQAANESASESWRAAVAQGLIPAAEVRRYLIVARDERLCTICAPIPELNANGVALEEDFSTPIGPRYSGPFHPQCRCTVFIRREEAGVRQRPAPGTVRPLAFT